MADTRSKTEKEFAEAQTQMKKALSENERLQKELEKVEGENRALIVENERLKKQVEELKAYAPKEEEGLIEVVALPANPNVKVAPKTEKGKKVKEIVDDDGFHHFFVSREHAIALLGATAGLKHVLAGPDKKMTFERLNGLYSEQITVYRHVKVKNTKGGAQWVPSIEEGEGE